MVKRWVADRHDERAASKDESLTGRPWCCALIRRRRLLIGRDAEWKTTYRGMNG